MSVFSALLNGLLPASFRGVPFATLSTGVAGGRRIANHTYPGRDDPWAEDMGRAQRQFRMRGFLVEGDQVYFGGPVILQRLLLKNALEQSGPGLLTHPTQGIMKVSVRSFAISEELDASRRSMIEIDFIESGKRVFPQLIGGSSGLLSAANLAKLAIAADVARVAVAAFTSIGGAAATTATSTACAAQVTAKAQDATSIRNLAAQLPGNYGRYAGGANAGFVGATASPYAADTTIDALIADASAQRAAIAVAANAFVVAAQDLSSAIASTAFATSMSTLVTALLAACADPADAVRLLTGVLENPPAQAAVSTPASSIVTMAFLRNVATALAQACAQYQPASYDDAFALLARASSLINDVATQAADVGDDESFAALRALRVAVVSDLRARGAQLAPVRTFNVPAPVPALVLAQRFYRDPTRADELVGETSVPNPLFMPVQIQALAA